MAQIRNVKLNADSNSGMNAEKAGVRSSNFDEGRLSRDDFDEIDKSTLKSSAKNHFSGQKKEIFGMTDNFKGAVRTDTENDGKFMKEQMKNKKGGKIKPVQKKEPYLNKSGKRQNRPKHPEHTEKSNNRWLWVLYVVAVLAVTFMLYVFYDFFTAQNADEPEKTVSTLTSQGIVEQIYFEDISLAGMSLQEFSEALSEKNKDFGKKTLQFVNDKDETKHLKLSVNDLGYAYDEKILYKNATQLSDAIKAKQEKQKEQKERKTSGFWANLVNAAENVQLSQRELDGLAIQDGKKIILLPVYKTDQVKLDNAVENIKKSLGKEAETAKNIKFNLESLQFEYPVKEKGFSIESDAIIKTINTAFEKNKLNEKILLPFKWIETGLTPEEVNEKLGYISSGYTEFVTYDPPRDGNVARVSELLTGLVIMPGETFSYLDAISPVSADNGYFEGYQIGSDGQPEKAIGGGICQGSSTLYNAVCKADLEIIERNNHTVPSVYIYQGLDAMVSDWSDFKFKNNTQYPIAIVGTCVPNEYIQFDIYGRKLEPGVTIDMDPYYIGDDQPGAPKRVLNKELAAGTEIVKTPAIIGSYWSTDKVYYKDGVEFKREHFSNSHYWSYVAVIEYGPEGSATTDIVAPTSSLSTTPPPSTTPPETTTVPPTTTPPESTPPESTPPESTP